MTRTLMVALVGVLGLLTSAFAPTPLAPPAEVTATPLSAPQPDWYTANLHQQVLAAAEHGQGVALPDGAEVPASALAFTGIRPGSWMVSPAGCTLNFVFGSVDSTATSTTTASNGNGKGNGKGQGRAKKAASSGDAFIGTAGHCTEVGEQVTIVAAPGILMHIGTTVTSVDGGVGDDFALIDVRPEMEQYVNPSTAYFGGPTAAGDPQFGDVVTHAGHGLVIGTGGTPRTGVVVYRGPGEEGGTSDAFAWDGAAAPGDSGSFVLEADGTAAGDLTHLVVGGPYVPGNVAGTSIDRMLQIAGRPLATAPVGPDPTS